MVQWKNAALVWLRREFDSPWELFRRVYTREAGRARRRSYTPLQVGSSPTPGIHRSLPSTKWLECRVFQARENGFETRRQLSAPAEWTVAVF